MTATACLGEGEEGGGDGTAGGGTVTVLDAFTEDADLAGFESVVSAFEEETDHTVEVEHSSAFEETALTRVEGGNPPDVIVHPQPGLLEDFVERDAAQPLEFMDTGQVSEDLVSGLSELATFDGQLYGLPIKLQLKSLVWYPTQPFEDAGYEEPQSWEEMISLTEQIAADGTTPWCIGIESGDATGWVATDWVEDVMLRLHGADTYDDWVSHELPFDSPEVTAAFEEVGNIWFNQDWVLGGRQGILSTPFGDAPLPMFEDPPGCMLHRQASFIEGNFPDDAEYGTDYDFFTLPPIGDEPPAPGLTAGDTMALYTDNPAAQEFVEFWATPDAQEIWAAEGSYLCTLTTCASEAYSSESFVAQDEFLSNAPFVRFDASDLMPGEVGGQAFFSEVVSWIADEQDLQATLSNIDAAWPEDSGDGATEEASPAATATE